MKTMHTSAAAGESQAARILRVLEARAGQWVPMIELHQASGSMAVHSRIADLRAAGHEIRQRNDRKGRMVHSNYLLVAGERQGELF